MGLRDDITADITAAFDTDLADAVSGFTGSRVVGQGPYDPVTETRPTITETYSGRGVFGSFDLRVVDGLAILRTDIKLTALQAEVSGTPKIDDSIRQMDGATGLPTGPQYKVIQVGQDPASAAWSLQIRRT